MYVTVIHIHALFQRHSGNSIDIYMIRLLCQCFLFVPLPLGNKSIEMSTLTSTLDSSFNFFLLSFIHTRFPVTRILTQFLMSISLRRHIYYQVMFLNSIS